MCVRSQLVLKEAVQEKSTTYGRVGMGRVGEGRRMSNKTSIPLEEKQAHRKQYSGLPSKTGPTKRSKHIVKNTK